MNSTEEIRRVSFGPKAGEKPDGLLADFLVEGENAETILTSAREAWRAAIEQNDPAGLSLAAWRQVLPYWFIDRCGPEISIEEAVRRRSLPMAERVKLAETWSLSAWVHWLRPTERQWVWWDAHVTSPRSLRVVVVVKGYPFPAGSLQWLLKCAGAESVELLE
jgi:hypothetical protein